LSDALARIQSRLATLYDLDSPHIAPFVCDEAQARAAVGADVERGEVLVTLEAPDGVFVGLYVAEKALAALEAGEGGSFDAYCLAAEGVSHFVYLVFRHENDDAVTQLELELQAEVDKYAMAVLEGRGVGLIRQRSAALRMRLFENVAYVDPPSSERGERYRVANRVAARYAHGLERRYLDDGDVAGFVAELRRFYRLGGNAKLAHARRR